MKNLLPIFLFALTLVSCTHPKQKVDLIVHHGVVYTVDSGFTTAEAFAVKDGKFVAVWKNCFTRLNYAPLKS